MPRGALGRAGPCVAALAGPPPRRSFRGPALLLRAVLTPAFLGQYLRTMGVHPAAPFLAWVLEHVAVVTVSSAALATVLKASGIFAHSDAFVVFLFLLDFGVSVVMLSYLLSAFFSQANRAALWTSLVYLVSFLPYILLLVLRNQLSAAAQTLLVSGVFCRSAKWNEAATSQQSRCPPVSRRALRHLPACTVPAGPPRRGSSGPAGVLGEARRGSLGRGQRPQGKVWLTLCFVERKEFPKLFY